MPKVKDLGITVVPEQFRPVEIGAGGGCGFRTWCGVSFCTDCTTQAFSICGTSPGPGAQAVGCTDCTREQFSICGTTRGGVPQAMPGGGCTDCTTQQFSICGGTHGGGGCSDCTTQQFSICGTTPGSCTDCTTQQFSFCGTTRQGCGVTFCTDCTTQPFSICGTTGGQCLMNTTGLCGITRGGIACRLQSRFPTVLDVTTPCGGSMDPTILQQSGLTLEDIAKIKDALQSQIKALEEHEKTLGPQTVEEIDAREQQLNAELSKLKSLRSEMGKKK